MPRWTSQERGGDWLSPHVHASERHGVDGVVTTSAGSVACLRCLMTHVEDGRELLLRRQMSLAKLRPLLALAGEQLAGELEARLIGVVEQTAAEWDGTSGLRAFGGLAVAALAALAARLGRTDEQLDCLNRLLRTVAWSRALLYVDWLARLLDHAAPGQRAERWTPLIRVLAHSALPHPLPGLQQAVAAVLVRLHRLDAPTTLLAVAGHQRQGTLLLATCLLHAADDAPQLHADLLELLLALARSAAYADDVERGLVACLDALKTLVFSAVAVVQQRCVELCALLAASSLPDAQLLFVRSDLLDFLFELLDRDVAAQLRLDVVAAVEALFQRLPAAAWQQLTTTNNNNNNNNSSSSSSSEDDDHCLGHWLDLIARLVAAAQRADDACVARCLRIAVRLLAADARLAGTAAAASLLSSLTDWPRPGQSPQLFADLMALLAALLPRHHHQHDVWLQHAVRAAQAVNCDSDGDAAGRLLLLRAAMRLCRRCLQRADEQQLVVFACKLADWYVLPALLPAVARCPVGALRLLRLLLARCPAAVRAPLRSKLLRAGLLSTVLSVVITNTRHDNNDNDNDDDDDDDDHDDDDDIGQLRYDVIVQLLQDDRSVGHRAGQAACDGDPSSLGRLVATSAHVEQTAFAVAVLALGVRHDDWLLEARCLREAVESLLLDRLRLRQLRAHCAGAFVALIGLYADCTACADGETPRHDGVVAHNVLANLDAHGPPALDALPDACLAWLWDQPAFFDYNCACVAHWLQHDAARLLAAYRRHAGERSFPVPGLCRLMQSSAATTGLLAFVQALIVDEPKLLPLLVANDAFTVAAAERHEPAALAGLLFAALKRARLADPRLAELALALAQRLEPRHCQADGVLAADVLLMVLVYRDACPQLAAAAPLLRRRQAQLASAADDVPAALRRSFWLVNLSLLLEAVRQRLDCLDADALLGVVLPLCGDAAQALSVRALAWRLLAALCGDDDRPTRSRLCSADLLLAAVEEYAAAVHAGAPPLASAAVAALARLLPLVGVDALRGWLAVLADASLALLRDGQRRCAAAAAAADYLAVYARAVDDDDAQALAGEDWRLLFVQYQDAPRVLRRLAAVCSRLVRLPSGCLSAGQRQLLDELAVQPRRRSKPTQQPWLAVDEHSSYVILRRHYIDED